MIDMFAVFAIGVVVGMSIILFSELIFKMREADKELRKNMKDEVSDENAYSKK